MLVVELIFDADCPNVPDTRAALRRALAAAGLAAHWQEWDRANPESPVYVRGFGSPTVLVEGRDVAGLGPSDAPSCRLYKDTQGRNRGVPPDELILGALRGTARRDREAALAAAQRRAQSRNG
jgi:hypothetical protein